MDGQQPEIWDNLTHFHLMALKHDKRGSEGADSVSVVETTEGFR